MREEEGDLGGGGRGLRWMNREEERKRVAYEKEEEEEEGVECLIYKRGI